MSSRPLLIRNGPRIKIENVKHYEDYWSLWVDVLAAMIRADTTEGAESLVSSLYDIINTKIVDDFIEVVDKGAQADEG